jgi:hypothetical protein
MKETDFKSYFRYWGKADPNYPDELKWYLQVNHRLDLPIFTGILLDRNP